jgi:hypothetical protein
VRTIYLQRIGTKGAIFKDKKCKPIVGFCL